ncbi:TPA: host cell division inhibitor Icd-like protein [Salmonella enterica subsp. enterica serovar Newport]
MFARKHLTCPRKIKVALVKRPVAFVIVEVNFHTIIVRTKNNFAICHLPLHTTACYRYPALYKTSAGIETPCKSKATPDAASVFFVVCYTRHSMAWCAYLMTNSPQAFDHATAHRAALIMVTLAGQPQGWPVPFDAGSLNPVNVTAPIEIETSSGDSLIKSKEAAAMVATPTPSHPKFIWRFYSGQSATCHTVTATSEHEARKALAPRYILSLSAVLPVSEVRHD